MSDTNTLEVVNKAARFAHVYAILDIIREASRRAEQVGGTILAASISANSVRGGT